MQLYVHLTHKNVAHAFDRLKTCWMMPKSVNKLKLNPDKTKFVIFVSKHNVKNSTNLPQSLFFVISFLLQKQLGTLVYALTVIFPFQGMSRKSVSPVFLKSVSYASQRLSDTSCCSYGFECFVGS